MREHRENDYVSSYFVLESSPRRGSVKPKSHYMPKDQKTLTTKNTKKERFTTKDMKSTKKKVEIDIS